MWNGELNVVINSTNCNLMGLVFVKKALWRAD